MRILAEIIGLVLIAAALWIGFKPIINKLIAKEKK